MTIYILHEDPKLCAEILDDKSLGKMIKDIAQALCNVHHLESDYINDIDYFDDNIPLEYSLHATKKRPLTDWSDWPRKCKANYLRLVALGSACAKELIHRFENIKVPCQKYRRVITWALDNIPDLPLAVKYGNGNETRYVLNGDCTPVPLVMPKKYICGDGSRFNTSIEQSYRNWYQSKLRQKPGCFTTWTNRTQPEWLNLES